MSKISTTAINNYNAAVTRQSGRVGNVRYYQKNGLTYVRSASNSAKSISSSRSQLRQRIKWASLSALWTIFNGCLAKCFSRKARNNSDYHAFMKANAMNFDEVYAYMTFDQKYNGGAVAMPVVISDGKLTSIECSFDDQDFVSDIRVTLTPSASTTVGELCANIIANNPDFKQDDEIALVALIQGGTEAAPKVTLMKSRLVLDPTNEESIGDLEGFEVVSRALGISDAAEGCYTYFHSRKQYGKLLVSSQQLVAKNSFLAHFMSEGQFELAAESYEEMKETFADPDDEEQTEGSLTLACQVNPSGSGSISIDGASASSSPTVSVVAGTTHTIRAIAGDDYQFVRWSDGSTAPYRSITVNESKTLTAYFQEA